DAQFPRILCVASQSVSWFVDNQTSGIKQHLSSADFDKQCFLIILKLLKTLLCSTTAEAGEVRIIVSTAERVEKKLPSC
ncbi:hypothetical protein Gotri_016044, partial [Gossypium trilobum]|nr:hypothetical protein [Gossypium trilobum]